MTRDEPGAVRSPELLKDGAFTSWRGRHGSGPLTPAEADCFLRGRVSAWLSLSADSRRQFSLREYLGMTDEELASWVLTSVVPARLRRVWGL